MNKNNTPLSTKKHSNTRGANFVEYLVLVGVLALAGIGIFQSFGSQVKEATTKQGDAVKAIPTNH